MIFIAAEIALTIVRIRKAVKKLGARRLWKQNIRRRKSRK